MVLGMVSHIKSCSSCWLIVLLVSSKHSECVVSPPPIIPVTHQTQLDWTSVENSTQRNCILFSPLLVCDELVCGCGHAIVYHYQCLTTDEWLWACPPHVHRLNSSHRFQSVFVGGCNAHEKGNEKSAHLIMLGRCNSCCVVSVGQKLAPLVRVDVKL